MKNNNAENPKIVSEKLGVLEQFMELIKKYGPFRLFGGTLLFVAISYLLYVALTPKAMFERYDDYIAEVHAKSNTYRIQSAPLIRNYLNQLATETGADMTYVLEYHNGKSNPSGLQWQYADMTFINDNSVDYRDGFQNISLVKYNIFYELYENVLWMGDINELVLIDKRAGTMAEMDSVKFIAMTTMYSSDMRELGVLGIVYINNEKEIDDIKLRKSLRMYNSSISPLLDGKNAMKIKY